MSGPNDQSDPSHSHHEREHFFGAAKLIALITMGSRVLGMVRDIAIVSLGANRMMDAFWTAFRIPNLFRRLFGEGAISAAFIPIFTETSETQGLQRARNILANCTGLLAIILASLLVIIELCLLTAILLEPGGWDRQLLIKLSMTVMPFMFTICLLALGSAALQCKGKFAYPAFAPIVLNIFLIAAAVAAHWLVDDQQEAGLFILAGAVVIAGVVQLAGVWWLLARVGLWARPRLGPVLPEVKRIAALTMPMLIPLGVAQISALFDSLYAWIMSGTPESSELTILGITFAKPLTEGVVTCLYAAERLNNFPLGILAISLATAVFPLFSRYASRGDTEGLRNATNRALRLSLFLGIPSGVALVILARPAIQLIYGHGQFSPDDVARAAGILQAYSLGMWAYFSRHILLRAFFSVADVRTPLKISCWMAAANMALVAGLVFTPLGSRAFGLATAVTATANVIALSWVLRRRWGRIGMRKIVNSCLKILLATAVMSGAIIAAIHFLAPLAEQIASKIQISWADSGILVIAGIFAGLAGFFITAWLLRCHELGELLGSLKGKPDKISDKTAGPSE